MTRDKVMLDVCRQVQEGVRERFRKVHDQNVETSWISPQVLLITAKRVSGDRVFSVTVRELT